MEKIRQALKATFPSFQDADFDERLRLDQIKGWDSMSAINLVMELDQIYNGRLAETELRGDMTISDLVALIAARAGR